MHIRPHTSANNKPRLFQPFNPSTFQHLSSRPAGFTLLEMVMVLFIMALFVGVASFSFQGSDDEEALRKPASELQRLARDAVRRAGMYEQTQTIEFQKTGFAMRFAKDPADVKKGEENQIWLKQVKVPDKMKLSILRWGSTKWQAAPGQRWVMLPSGLCEPISVRMELGRSYIEMRFNPLTGGVQDEVLSAGNP